MIVLIVFSLLTHLAYCDKISYLNSNYRYKLKLFFFSGKCTSICLEISSFCSISGFVVIIKRLEDIGLNILKLIILLVGLQFTSGMFSFLLAEETCVT